MRVACDYYAEHAESHLAHDVVRTEGAKSYVAFEPLGVVLAIMPWNFPLWQVYRFAARHDLRDALHEQVRASVERGASLLLGGEIPPGEGAYYPPTVLSDVKPGMPAYDEELFGPVAAIIAAKDDADAVRIANDTVFGLGGAVFTRDAARGESLARQLEAGATFVNSPVASDPRLPFGGIKESGYGRELGSYGIKEFVNIKTVYVK